MHPISKWWGLWHEKCSIHHGSLKRESARVRAAIFQQNYICYSPRENEMCIKKREKCEEAQIWVSGGLAFTDTLTTCREWWVNQKDLENGFRMIYLKGKRLADISQRTVMIQRLWILMSGSGRQGGRERSKSMSKWSKRGVRISQSEDSHALKPGEMTAWLDWPSEGWLTEVEGGD